MPQVGGAVTLGRFTAEWTTPLPVPYTVEWQAPLPIPEIYAEWQGPAAARTNLPPNGTPLPVPFTAEWTAPLPIPEKYTAEWVAPLPWAGYGRMASTAANPYTLRMGTAPLPIGKIYSRWTAPLPIGGYAAEWQAPLPIPIPLVGCPATNPVRARRNGLHRCQYQIGIRSNGWPRCRFVAALNTCLVDRTAADHNPDRTLVTGGLRVLIPGHAAAGRLPVWEASEGVTALAGRYTTGAGI